MYTYVCIHITKHIREEVLPDLQHLLLHARLHLTLLVHLRNRSAPLDDTTFSFKYRPAALVMVPKDPI